MLPCSVLSYEYHLPVEKQSVGELWMVDEDGWATNALAVRAEARGVARTEWLVRRVSCSLAGRLFSWLVTLLDGFAGGLERVG